MSDIGYAGRVGITGMVLLWISALSFSEESNLLRVLPMDYRVEKTDQMMRDYQRGKVHAALDVRLREFERALKTPDQIADYQKRRRSYLVETFGPIPAPGPLNAKVTGVIREQGFSIEKILYDSVPGFPVTANLYLPEGSGPFPAILLPCGHSKNGKAYSSYQKACRLLVQNGFVVLCFDPIGQGERRQLIGPKRHPLIKATSEHNQLGVVPILLGSNLANFMVRDGVRGIDYLCSRPEVDPQRIGCTGNSGGGNLTSFLMGYDQRIAAAAPGCFMTTHRRKNESPGPGDAEQNLFAQIAEGFDHPDFAIAAAPKPVLILAATKDFVPIEGTWEAFRQTKRFYCALGFPDRIDLIEVDEKHGFSKGLREGAVRFFARWLQDRKLEVFEQTEVKVLSDAELQVTPDGQVLWMDDVRSIFDLFSEEIQQLKASREEITSQVVRRVTGIRPNDQLPEPMVESFGGDHLEKLIFHPEPGIDLPALFWRQGDKAPVMIAPGKGMNAALSVARELHKSGHPVLIVEVRDTGETKTRNWRFYGADSFIGQMLGRSWLAMRCEDLQVCARWLSEICNRKPVTLYSDGEAGPAALHAGFLEPELIKQVQVEDSLDSWESLMRDRDAYRHIHQAVHGALQFYDLPDLMRLAGK